MAKEQTFHFKNTTFLPNPPYKLLILLFLFFSLWSLLLQSYSRPFLRKSSISSRTGDVGAHIVAPNVVNQNVDKVNDSKLVSCPHNMSVYVYDLPSKFNADLLHNCAHLNNYGSMCPHVANRGLGQPLFRRGSDHAGDDQYVWFATNQFTGEEIFHSRMENHPCRSKDPSRASLFYVPFYGGFHMSSKMREVNHTARDELAMQLADYVKLQPWWHRRNGKDHFMVLGRTAWDFMRPDQDRPDRWNDYGPNNLFSHPTVKNMSVFVLERHPWQGHNQHGIPYPSYFHPSTSDQLAHWQRIVQESKRPYLFSFVGAKRKEGESAAIRDELMRQCSDSKRCNMINCTTNLAQCNNPARVLRAMKESQFCLQARGDSFTRRSLFDSILAGCIPVVFSRHTAYTQYEMYLPDDTRSYSVFIEEEEVVGRKMNVEKELEKIGSLEVGEMRKVVVDLIPRLTFAHPDAGGDKGFDDAVDVAISSLLRKLK